MDDSVDTVEKNRGKEFVTEVLGSLATAFAGAIATFVTPILATYLLRLYKTHKAKKNRPTE